MSRSESGELQKVGRGDAVELARRLEEAMELLRWVGERLGTRDANGHRTRLFCVLCSGSRRRRLERCRHEEIWRLTGVEGRDGKGQGGASPVRG